ncbi:uncharacterized protein F5147DRAFT_738366 [Suillus discolor]|uniref:Uncharacterized protein n=1 Tax=Suillus discolor TaxID=1912936 RepID=A0A9P7EQ67_9AGAM|nr:uncharacterized protein F5147DRAFT_738366 [Suillus discolor]KAG2080361.1 hypothetical protein F5147DRAFT_738366 [Suillus discolor]
MALHIIAHRCVVFWTHFLININFINSNVFPSWTGVGFVISMAATWLFAVALVRIPSTRRMCQEDLSGLWLLCWAFCVLWGSILLWYDSEWYDRETLRLEWKWTDLLKDLAIIFGSTLAWALEFVVMLCFWGNLQWKDPIATFGWFIFLGPVVRDVEEGDPENDLDLFVNSSLLHEDHDFTARPRRLLLPGNGNTVQSDLF